MTTPTPGCGCPPGWHDPAAPTPEVVLGAEERVRRFLDERARPTHSAPQGFLPVDLLATITRTGDSLRASDLRALLDALAAERAAHEGPRPQPCSLCSHPPHGDSECGEVVGYDHLNGDHECGCPGEEAALRARIEALIAAAHWMDDGDQGDGAMVVYRDDLAAALPSPDEPV